MTSSKGGCVMTIDELKKEFGRLSDQDKMAFMKSIAPSFCAVFGKNPETMMGGIMSMCRDMMKSCNMDMRGMIKMMSMTGGKHE